MKKFAIAAIIAVAATTAVSAGTIVEPYIEPEVIIEEAATSSGAGLIVPLMLIAIIAAVASN